MDLNFYKDMDIQTMKKTPCPVSSVYDQKHYDKYDFRCRFKHSVFHWEGTVDNQIGLISDSIFKWVNDTPHVELQAFPGMTLESAFDKLVAGQVKISGFHGIILHLGTNSLHTHDPSTIGDLMLDIIFFLQHVVPFTRLGVSMIIPRPKDPQDFDKKRRIVNSVLKKLCKTMGLTYFRSYKGVTTNNKFDKGLYANDKLHLKLQGIRTMRRFLRGAAVTMLDDIPKGTRSQDQRTNTQSRQ
jgi:hypothetical protein